MRQQRSRLRLTSWFLGAAAVAVPGAFLQYQIAQFDAWASTQGGVVCGMPLLAAWAVAGLLCCALSLIASVLNGIHLYRSTTTSAWRRAELALTLAPAALIGLYVAAMTVR